MSAETSSRAPPARLSRLTSVSGRNRDQRASSSCTRCSSRAGSSGGPSTTSTRARVPMAAKRRSAGTGATLRRRGGRSSRAVARVARRGGRPALRPVRRAGGRVRRGRLGGRRRAGCRRGGLAPVVGAHRGAHRHGRDQAGEGADPGGEGDGPGPTGGVARARTSGRVEAVAAWPGAGGGEPAGAAVGGLGGEVGGPGGAVGGWLGLVAVSGRYEGVGFESAAMVGGCRSVAKPDVKRYGPGPVRRMVAGGPDRSGAPTRPLRRGGLGDPRPRRRWSHHRRPACEDPVSGVRSRQESDHGPNGWVGSRHDRATPAGRP